MFQPGTHIAHHMIVRLLGVGRLAEVYEVIAADRKLRALKVLKTDVSPLVTTPNARLGREGDVLASIDNVHVVRFFGVGVQQGRVWLLLELVKGCDLLQLVRGAGGRLPLDRAVSILRQACEGVDAAHAQEILHCDLKPENILVGDDDLTKVADFSSSRLTGWGVKTTTDQEEDRSLLYRAPERWRGGAVDARSDVYALGVVLHEILTGENPIVSGPASMAVVCERQLHHVPPPLVTLGLGIPSDLSDLVERALSKEPVHRPTMREMADTLAHVLWRLQAPRRAAARSVPLACKEDRLAPTEPAMPVFETFEAGAPGGAGEIAAAGRASGAGGTIPMAAFAEASGGGVSSWKGSSQAASGQAEAALGQAEAAQPASSGKAPTLRSPSQPEAAAVVVMSQGAERASTGVPVERSVSRATRAPRGAARAMGVVGAVAVLGLAAAGWWGMGRGVGSTGGPAVRAATGAVPTASATGVSSPAASGSAVAPVPAVSAAAGAPRAKPVGSAAAHPRGAPPRSKLPFP